MFQNVPVYRNLQPKKNPISDDYRITGSVLGLGINGKVVECFQKTSNQKCALKVFRTKIDIIFTVTIVRTISGQQGKIHLQQFWKKTSSKPIVILYFYLLFLLTSSTKSYSPSTVLENYCSLWSLLLILRHCLYYIRHE